MIKLFITDIDGTLTDGCVYVSEKGEEMKKFSHRDGRGIYLLSKLGVKIAMMTSEKGGINKARADKLLRLGTLSDFFDDSVGGGKLEKAKVLCKKYKIKMSEVAFIADDTNDLELLQQVGYPAIVGDANKKLKHYAYCNHLFECKAKGGNGAVREFIDYIIMVSATTA